MKNTNTQTNAAREAGHGTSYTRINRCQCGTIIGNDRTTCYSPKCTKPAEGAQSALTAESLTIAINRIRSGEYGDGIRERFERQGGPLQFRTLCMAAGISGD